MSSRRMLAALGLIATQGSFLEQIAITMDGLDNWMLESGNIMRQEPLARLGFALYFVVMHVWCFGLVFFHGIESEHHDLRVFNTHKGILTQS